MKKEAKKTIIDTSILVFIGAFLFCLAWMDLNKEKKDFQRKTEYQPPKVDKVSDTYNARKIEWLESVYNYELNNKKP